MNTTIATDNVSKGIKGPKPVSIAIEGNDGIEYWISRTNIDKLIDATVLWYVNGKQGKFPLPSDFGGEKVALNSFQVNEKCTIKQLLNLKIVYAMGKEREQATIDAASNGKPAVAK